MGLVVGHPLENLPDDPSETMYPDYDDDIRRRGKSTFHLQNCGLARFRSPVSMSAPIEGFYFGLY